jgi:hypothetical protein
VLSIKPRSGETRRRRRKEGGRRGMHTDNGIVSLVLEQTVGMFNLLPRLNRIDSPLRILIRISKVIIY